MCKHLNPDGGFKGIMEVPDPYYGGAKGFELVSYDVRGTFFTQTRVHLHPAGYSASAAFTLNRAFVPLRQAAADLVCAAECESGSACRCWTCWKMRARACCNIYRSMISTVVLRK